MPESIMFPRTYHLIARRLLFSFAGSWRIQYKHSSSDSRRDPDKEHHQSFKKKLTLKVQVQNQALFHEENFSSYTSFRELLFSCANSTAIKWDFCHVIGLLFKYLCVIDSEKQFCSSSVSENSQKKFFYVTNIHF